MRYSRLYLVGFGLLTCVAVASAQAKSDKNGKNAKVETDPAAVEVRFADGSVVKMVLLTDTIEVGTRYGKLKVAANEIRRIDFGLRIPEETLKRIDAAIGNLGSPEFSKREAAGKELLSLKELAFPAVQGAAKSNDAEVARRAQDLLKLMTEHTPAERLRLKKHDTIITTEFPIVGLIETAALKAKTPYFGEVKLQLAELRDARLASEQEAKVVVDAAKYGGQQEAWLDTGIEITADAGLDITASGTVDLWPVPGQAGQYMASPAGMQGGQPVPGGFAAAGGRRGAGFVRQLPGALLGRIGETGRTFVVGAKFEGVPTEDGKLYLRIVPSPWNNESSGTYDVRISVGGAGGR